MYLTKSRYQEGDLVFYRGTSWRVKSCKNGWATVWRRNGILSRQTQKVRTTELF